MTSFHVWILLSNLYTIAGLMGAGPLAFVASVVWFGVAIYDVVSA